MGNNASFISDKYKDILMKLNETIEMTIKMQRNTQGNSNEYRRSLRNQIELEKAKLNIMQSLEYSFDTSMLHEEVMGITGDGRPIVEKKIIKDVRFDPNSSSK